MLLAQIETISEVAPSNIVQMLGGLTSLGFTVWYCWYNESYAKPARDKIQADTITNVVKEFRDESKEQRASHAATVERLSASIERALTK
jgi:hypothetical protein